MRKVLAILICTVFALTGCSIENGNQRPDDKKLRDGIKLILTYMERSHPDLINWEKSAVSNQINKKLPAGYATDAGWTIKWSNPITGELPQVIVPWDLLGQFPTKTNLDVNDYHAGTYAPQSVISEISRLQIKNDLYFAAIVNVKISDRNTKWVAFTRVPYLPVTDPGYGWAHSENGLWVIKDFGTATVGCGQVPSEVQSEFGFTCPGN